MKSVPAWAKGVVVAAGLGALGGCSLVHSELGTLLKEPKSYKEWSTWDYPGNETGNRHAYEGKK